MDPLSDMLNFLTVERAAQVRFESQGPYAMRFGGVDHIKFGALLSGRVRLWVDGDAEPLSLEAGDCYLLTDGRPYRTANADDFPEIDGDVFFATARDDNGVVRWGGSPPDKIVIGGSFLFDEEGAAWLRGALPPPSTSPPRLRPPNPFGQPSRCSGPRQDVACRVRRLSSIVSPTSCSSRRSERISQRISLPDVLQPVLQADVRLFAIRSSHRGRRQSLLNGDLNHKSNLIGPEP